MDGKRDRDCRRAAIVLLTACDGISACAPIHAESLVRLADRRGTCCSYLHFYPHCTAARCPVWILSIDYDQQQRAGAHWDLPAAECCVLSGGARSPEKEDTIESI